jgi:hypothetical protein
MPPSNEEFKIRWIGIFSNKKIQIFIFFEMPWFSSFIITYNPFHIEMSKLSHGVLNQSHV